MSERMGPLQRALLLRSASLRPAKPIHFLWTMVEPHKALTSNECQSARVIHDDASELRRTSVESTRQENYQWRKRKVIEAVSSSRQTPRPSVDSSTSWPERTLAPRELCRNQQQTKRSSHARFIWSDPERGLYRTEGIKNRRVMTIGW